MNGGDPISYEPQAKHAERIARIIDENNQHLVSPERLSVQALCEIARQLARLAELKEFEMGLEEDEDLDDLSPEDLDEINKLPPAKEAKG